MSQNFRIDATLQVDRPATKIDNKFWSAVLTAAVYNPRKALADGVAAALDGYKNRAGWEEDYLEDGDEFEETDDYDAEENLEEDMPVPTFTFEKEVTLSGGYSLEKYIDDANKVVYRAGVEKGIKVCLKIDHTSLDRGPDDSVTTKWHEMVEQFGRDA